MHAIELDRRRLAQIDVMRAIACSTVVVHHYFKPDVFAPAGQIGPVAEFFLRDLDLGKFGVLLFFLISGYCVTFTICDTKSHPYTRFVASRVFRLYPAYWLSLIVILALAPSGAFSATEVAANFTLLQRFLGFPYVNGVAWTLTVELIFYGLCMVLFFCRVLSSYRRLHTFFFFLLGLVPTLAALDALGVLRVPQFVLQHLVYISLMMFGAVIRSWHDRGGVLSLRSWAVVALYAAAATASHLLVPFDAGNPWHGIFFAHAAALVVFGTMLLGFARIQGRLKPAIYVGRISYSVYLLHLSIIHVLVDLYGVSGGAGVVIILVVTYAAAALVYEVVEYPMIRAGRRFVRYLTDPPRMQESTN